MLIYTNNLEIIDLLLAKSYYLSSYYLSRGTSQEYRGCSKKYIKIKINYGLICKKQNKIKKTEFAF